MHKHFYTHIIEIETIIVELDSLDLSPSQKLHLSHLIDSSLHNVILDAILSELDEIDKKTFIYHLSTNDHSQIWILLNQKIENVEMKIKQTAENLKQEFYKDLQEAKRIKHK